MTRSIMGKSPFVKESVIEAELSAVVRGRGGLCVKVQAIGRRGFFDRIILLPGGRIIFAEIKRPRGGRVSPHQRQYLALFKMLDVEVALIKNSADIAALFL